MTTVVHRVLGSQGQPIVGLEVTALLMRRQDLVTSYRLRVPDTNEFTEAKLARQFVATSDTTGLLTWDLPANEYVYPAGTYYQIKGLTSQRMLAWVEDSAGPLELSQCLIEMIDFNSSNLVILRGPRGRRGDDTAGGTIGAVTSVNGKAGDVILVPSDIGAQPAGSYVSASALAAKADSSDVANALATKQDIASLGDAVINNTTVRQQTLVAWRPGEVVTASPITLRLSPDGVIIRRLDDGATRATYDSAEAARWTPLSGAPQTAAIPASVIVVHGTNSSTNRPATLDPVIWFGTVDPTNADVARDVWIPVTLTSAGARTRWLGSSGGGGGGGGGSTGTVAQTVTVNGAGQLAVNYTDGTSTLLATLLAIGTTSTTAKAGNYTPPIADLPAGTTLTVQKTGFTWPARPTSRADVIVQWKGADPSPPIVSTGTGGMLDNVDYRLVTA